jgi:drug/metabolite transporter (DMT)-like permease
LILALAADLGWLCLFSSLILKRTLTKTHWLSCFIAIFGYGMYDLVVYNGLSLSTFSITVNIQNWRGPVFCILSRMFSSLSGIISKRILLKKGYKERL